ncbi:Alpha/Beta hydrolase protein [Ilyonectria destructans]|nr:Alpha/Beta hydrolase protein [Ilyonectria destructans]
MLLIHGFPDLGFGWRYQIPYFMSLGFRVVVPDMLGFGATDAPDELEHYTLKSIAADIKELATSIVGAEQVILGGHGRGGAIVWRTALWHAELVLGVFSIGTPYNPPSPTFLFFEDVVASGRADGVNYHLQFEGATVQDEIQGIEKIQQFLNALYGGVGPRGEVGFNTKDGVLFENLPILGLSKHLTKQELDYYIENYLLHGSPEMKGPLNWYRTRWLNYVDELSVLDKPCKFIMPALCLTATKDQAFLPTMSAGMEKHFEHLTQGQVEGSHWVLWESSVEVNRQVAEWMEKVLLGSFEYSLSDY